MDGEAMKVDIDILARSARCNACRWGGTMAQLIYVTSTHGALWRCPSCHGDDVMMDIAKENQMVPGEEPDGEIVTEIEMKVTIMPTAIFETLWAGLGALDEFYAQGDKVDAARDWLNATMQGRVAGDWGY